MRYTNDTLPTKLRPFSPFQVEVVMDCGYDEDDTFAILSYIDDYGFHPDWSDFSDEQFADHFTLVKMTMEATS